MRDLIVSNRRRSRGFDSVVLQENFESQSSVMLRVGQPMAHAVNDGLDRHRFGENPRSVEGDDEILEILDALLRSFLEKFAAFADVVVAVLVPVIQACPDLGPMEKL